MQDLKKHIAEPSALRGVVDLDAKVDAELKKPDAMKTDQAKLYEAFKSLEMLQARTKSDEHPLACKHAMLQWAKVHLQKEKK